MRKLLFLAAFATCLNAAPPPPALRLARDVTPERIALDLTLNPARDDFSGKMTIDLNIKTAADHFWLNATDLKVTEARIETAGKSVNVQVIQSGAAGNDDFVGFQLPSALQPGKAQLALSYVGKVNLRSSEGVFRSRRKNDKYLFTQFEPLDARRAFPCFDEPGFKIPWQLTLHVPGDQVAVADTGVESETPESGGMKAVRFRETKPLPSYLIAFAVGPFEFVDAGTAGNRHVPVRIVVPRGDRGRAKYAAAITADILTRLENYFGIPYPYDKADQLAVPLSFGGAMENPGLVNYDANIILSPPGQDTPARQRRYAEVAAHELAHQWFGDMVTMSWWNDVWLNESFATWMSAKLVADWKPEWQTKAENQRARLAAIDVDTHASARRINQPVESKSDVGNAFDGITYEKGGSVLAMFENVIGAEPFRRAVHQYLTAHMFGNARTEDFLAALGQDSKQDYATAFATFLNQNGVPQVKVGLQCGTSGVPKLHLEQQRLLPVGSDAGRDALWNIPVCVAYSYGDGRKEVCRLLKSKTMNIPLNGKGCPSWYLANAHEVGYYQAVYPKGSVAKLLDHWHDLSLAERVGLIGDVKTQALTGTIPLDESLSLVPRLAADANRQIVTAVIELASVKNQLIPDDLRNDYAQFVDRNFGEPARKLGWVAKPGDTADDRLLRAKLVPFAGESGNDPELIQQARDLILRWFSDHTVVSPDIARGLLTVAAQHGDAGLFDKILATAKSEDDPYFRPIVIQSLGHFRDPQLAERSLKFAFDGTFDARMSMRLFFGPAGEPAVRKLPYEYLKRHYDTVVAKLPTGIGTDYAAELPRLASAFGCSESDRREVEQFFATRMQKVQGGPRSLANALETIQLCAAGKPAAEQSLRIFLASVTEHRTAKK
jgi:cytosol alanyl aminopeptidase